MGTETKPAGRRGILLMIPKPRHAGVVAALALLTATIGGAHAASSTALLSPTHTHVYKHWLVKSWQLRLAKPPGAPLCQHLRDTEVILDAPPPQRRREIHRCKVPAGRDVYIPGWGAECSTIEKKPFHGDTTAELRRCPRRYTRRAYSHIRWTIDGEAVRHPRAFEKASRVFHFRMPKHNVLRLRKRSGRAAAYGAGFLLRELVVGRHVVRRSDRFFGTRFKTTYIIRVTG